MKFALFYHSLLSDWNHGNAHFLRGVASELISRGHQVVVFEPADAWSYQNLIADHGSAPIERFAEVYPTLKSVRYGRLDVAAVLEDVDVAIVHEWSEPALVAAIGAYRSCHTHLRAFFHDTHHRAITAEHEMQRFDLSGYDGVLAYGAVLRDIYLARGWSANAWVWHEAADTGVFHPCPRDPMRDLVWVGNWGDDERTAELHEFLIEPAKALKLGADVFGVRYPEEGKSALSDAGIAYRGWVANVDVPELFGTSRFTVHVPRRAYVSRLKGIPTIRPFEAMACRIPLISAPWEDSERLFGAGDYLVARTGAEMKEQMSSVLSEPAAAAEMAARAQKTILSRHTCSHRVEELLQILRTIGSKESAGRNPIPAGALN